MKRHDYLPFGEELFAPAGGRTTAMGYASGDGVRQQFTQKERDVETGLDYFLARYYSSTQGRFTSPDDFWKDSQIGDPQSWNKYAYVRNNPLRYIDPSGEKATVKIETDEKNKTGTITITATFAIWTQKDSGVSQDDMNNAAFFIEKDIEEAWSGTYVQNGITYTVTTDIQVQVAESKIDGLKSNAQNVIEISNGPASSTADSYVNRHSYGGGADTGRWNLGKTASNTGIFGGVAKHEFTHLLGVGNRSSGGFLSSVPWFSNGSEKATAYDYGWALGGAINSHRTQSRRPVFTGRQWETLNAGGPHWGPPTSHRSIHTLRAPMPRIEWWR
jgi:RHS repeat-associated protein